MRTSSLLVVHPISLLFLRPTSVHIGPSVPQVRQLRTVFQAIIGLHEFHDIPCVLSPLDRIRTISAKLD